MSQRSDILKQFGEVLLEDMKPLAKRFAPTLELKVEDLSMEIKASPYISTLVDGRRPTSPSAPKGDPTLQEILYEWIQFNSITPNEAGMSQEALSWAMATSMHKYGDRLYQRGGGRDVFAEVLSESRIKNVSSLLGDNEQKFISESVFKGLKGL